MGRVNRLRVCAQASAGGLARERLGVSWTSDAGRGAVAVRHEARWTLLTVEAGPGCVEEGASRPGTRVSASMSRTNTRKQRIARAARRRAGGLVNEELAGGAQRLNVPGGQPRHVSCGVRMNPASQTQLSMLVDAVAGVLLLLGHAVQLSIGAAEELRNVLSGQASHLVRTSPE